MKMRTSSRGAIPERKLRSAVTASLAESEQTSTTLLTVLQPKGVRRWKRAIFPSKDTAAATCTWNECLRSFVSVMRGRTWTVKGTLSVAPDFARYVVRTSGVTVVLHVPSEFDRSVCGGAP